MLTPEIALGFTVLGTLVSISGTWAVMKFKQDAAEVRAEEVAAALRSEHVETTTELRNANTRLDNELRDLKQRFDGYRDIATQRREELTERLHGLEVAIASSDGAYRAINDRFTSLERTVEAGFNQVRDEIHGRKQRRENE